MDSFSPVVKLEHSDARGEIYSIALPDGQELMLLHSTPGALRGGHSHDCDEIVVMLSGRMRYYKKSAPHGEESINELVSGESSFNPAFQIHMGEFLEDTWLVEYKLWTHKGWWRQQNYGPYRDRVEANAAGR